TSWPPRPPRPTRPRPPRRRRSRATRSAPCSARCSASTTPPRRPRSPSPTRRTPRADAQRGRGGGAPRVSVDPLVAAGPLLVAQDELLDLAGGRLGQLGELHRRRALEPGQVVAAEGDDLVGGGRRPRLQRDEGLRALAPLVV